MIRRNICISANNIPDKYFTVTTKCEFYSVYLVVCCVVIIYDCVTIHYDYS